MKNLYVTLFSAFLLGSTICTGCAEKKTGSSGEVIEMIHKVNGYWQMNHPEHGRSFWDNAAYHTGNMEVYFLTKKPEYLNIRKSGLSIINGKELSRTIKPAGNTAMEKVTTMYFSEIIRFVFKPMLIYIIWSQIHKK